STPRRRPRPVEAPSPRTRRRPSLVTAAIAVGAVALVAAVQLIVGVALSQGAYELDALRTEQTKLAREQAERTEALERAESPQYLAANAEALGMVPNANPAFLRLSDGAVLGNPAPAVGGAAASSELVPNSLIAGLPLVTGEEGATDAGTAAPATPVDPAAPTVQPAPPVVDSLPTPTTH
ncbi:hypothetical protein, partial [Agromyces seonyuensis]